MKEWNQLQPLIACPFTHEPLQSITVDAAGTPSGHSFKILNGVPVLRHGPAPEIKDPNHISNPVSPAIQEMMVSCSGPVLFLGAGASDFRDANVFELEYNLFRNTDVVGDAHCLPFKTGVFQLAVALNVFEHLREPHLAAKELFRVLAPGGRVLIHTAFLQILHEEPFHFYDATEFGVRQWFRDFNAVEVVVSPNFHPYIGLSWTLNDLLFYVERHLGSEARRTVEQMTVGQWAQFWSKREHGNPEAWQVLNMLPPEVLHRFAAGFQLNAAKPAPCTGGAS